MIQKAVLRNIRKATRTWQTGIIFTMLGFIKIVSN